MNIGRSSGCFQNVTVLVCYYIAFHAFDRLVAVNSLLGTREGGTGTLTVNSSDSGLWRLASSKPDFLHKSVLKFGKGIQRSPASEIVIDYLPLGVFCRKQPPLTAAYIDVNYRVKYEGFPSQREPPVSQIPRRPRSGGCHHVGTGTHNHRFLLRRGGQKPQNAGRPHCAPLRNRIHSDGRGIHAVGMDAAEQTHMVAHIRARHNRTGINAPGNPALFH